MPVPAHLLANRADLEAVSRSRAAGVYYGDHRLLCRILGDYLAFVDTRDLMLGPRLVLDGFWESWVTLAIARYLRPGMRCIDVGANYGYYTILMSGACGPEGRVVACEPNPILAEMYLPQNLALNGFYHGVEICPKVVGNLDDQAVNFVLHEGDFATSSLERWAYAHRSGTVETPAITLDRLCADWPRLDLVKIDAEGAEALVWDGMQKILMRFPHAAVVMELHLQRDPAQTVEFLSCDPAINHHNVHERNQHILNRKRRLPSKRVRSTAFPSSTSRCWNDSSRSWPTFDRCFTERTKPFASAPTSEVFWGRKSARMWSPSRRSRHVR